MNDEKQRSIYPTIYINDMYMEYQKCESFYEVIILAAELVADQLKDNSDEIAQLDYSTVKDNVVVAVINTEQNLKMLSGVPHREFLDLSVIYYWLIEIDNDKIARTIINNDMIQELGLTEEILYQLAIENTAKRLPPITKK